MPFNLEPDPKEEFEHTLTEANFRSKCAACGEWIEVGDRIGKDSDDEWIHVNCAED